MRGIVRNAMGRLVVGRPRIAAAEPELDLGSVVLFVIGLVEIAVGWAALQTAADYTTIESAFGGILALFGGGGLATGWQLSPPAR
jgi:hypothetical protein